MNMKLKDAKLSFKPPNKLHIIAEGIEYIIDDSPGFALNKPFGTRGTFLTCMTGDCSWIYDVKCSDYPTPEKN